MAHEKKYSLISLDDGEPETLAAADAAQGVRTTRTTIDGEETIIVSSSSAVDEEPGLSVAETESASFRETTGSNANEPASKSERSFSAPARESSSTDRPLDADASTDAEEDDEVPFRRMQGVIIVCLIVVMVAFLVYFNFLR